VNFKVGDRIELVSMSLDPDPIAPGTKGTVDYINLNPPFSQIGVKWDSGRSLAVLPPFDQIRKI
jgi:Domain of unknown function (DUF4314)